MTLPFEFQGTLGKYRLTQTRAGDWTIYSEFFDENCHSLEGSVLETEAIYIQGTELKAQAELARQDHRPLFILEVGFGAGVGASRAWHFAQTIPEQEVHFYSLELDSELVRYAMSNGPFAQSFSQFKVSSLDPHWHGSSQNFHLHILIDDARHSIRRLREMKNIKFDAFFHDPFGPQKNPTLWTVEIFKDLKALTLPHSLLSTYSAAIGIRKALMEAEWAVEDRPGFGIKKSSTRARPSGTIDPALVQKLERSPIVALHEHPGLLDGKR
ncbi:MAG: hypothetical protein A2X86_10465 [Bdellovibrionales bacterium GWA2_49_15]|nr:MAG: hypothetical protein A2X86_10465 [Bdellovibrionales bacterium GWA2_49_15]HAZ14752.1 hypothetical protein [Bdellovibrionales bacterium]